MISLKTSSYLVAFTLTYIPLLPFANPIAPFIANPLSKRLDFAVHDPSACPLIFITELANVHRRCTVPERYTLRTPKQHGWVSNRPAPGTMTGNHGAKILAKTAGSASATTTKP